MRVGDQNLLEVFGTTRPTRPQIQAVELTAWGDLDGDYLVVYRDDLPDELYFMGASGD